MSKQPPEALPVATGGASASEGRWIRVRGARQNNLADVDVALPRGALTVVTGVSGSGKSSLAFDTLYAEGQRRYVESFSTYARQFLERMDRPDVDGIDGLLPAVAIEQRNTIRSARSTLGTLTELTDYLKVLYAARGQLHCEVCGEAVGVDLPGPVADELLATADGRRVMVTFPFHAGHGDDARVAFAYLTREGYRRVLVEGRAVDLDAVDPDTGGGRLDVLVDRLVVRASDRARLVEAIETAYRVGEDDASLHLEVPSEGGGGGFERRDLTRERRHCGVRYAEPREGLFSFNSPLGACGTCNGFGRVIDVDMDRVVPDHRLSLSQGAIKPWATGPSRADERKLMREACARVGIDLKTPFQELTPEQQRFVLEGEPGKGWKHRWFGVRGWFQWLERKSYKMHVRILLARYRAYVGCRDCEGRRFKPESLLYRLGGLTISQMLALSVSDALAWLDGLPPGPEDPALLAVTDQLRHRLTYLERVGLGYLSLDRQGRTLSGGEVQRANLTTAIGSGLVNALFVLDEPSIGLHPRDSERLSTLMAELTARDNTVVVVEHDPDVLRFADWVVEVGPGPGKAGGQIVHAGPPGALEAVAQAATTRALADRRGPRAAADADCGGLPGVTVRNARAQNLKGVDVHLPYDRLTVLTGVSGSGKSTFVEEVLHRGILRRRGEVTEPPGPHDGIEGLEAIRDVVWVDQAAPAASPRANPATYVKAWDGIRSIFARQPLAKERGFAAGTFSFNSSAGRCPACEGAGFERVEMQFLSDVFLVCEMCEGKRFKPEVLEVTWKGRSIADMLALTVDEAVALVGARTTAGRRLAALQQCGLGYLTLGQPLATLSGGESQRLKLAHHLGLERTRGTLFLFDEPSTGLHLADVDVLVANLKALVAAGNTVVVVEHHLDVIGAADHVVDLGPEGGQGGGQVVFAGPPAALARSGTHTGQHLARWLEGLDPLARQLDPLTQLGVAEQAARYGHAPEDEAIEIAGARVHNLKNVSVRLPRGGRTVVSGLSGSGKSSLAFDLVFAEGQRRFLDCLSPYARQYITQLGRPDADVVAGIPPTVAIEQRTTRGGAWSTVANVTEIEPFLRLLYARLGRAPSGVLDDRVPAAEVARQVAKKWKAKPVQLFAPVVRLRKGFHKAVFVRAASLGLTQVVLDGEVVPVDPPPKMRKTKAHTIELILGPVAADDGAEVARLVDEACRLGDGEVRVGPDAASARSFMVEPAWEAAGPRKSLDPRYFSPRTELGACEVCKGTGALTEAADAGEARCPECDGQRLGLVGRSITFGALTLPRVLEMNPSQLLVHLDGLAEALSERDRQVASGPLKAIAERAGFLLDVGLGYLTLDRLVPTLSGGEAQRIRLAAQLGAHLSGVLYVLDEPTIGLHPSDTQRLLTTLDRLQARGNGVLMVEHDEATLRTADVLVDMGPGAGDEGGQVLAAGPLAEVMADPRSVTGRCLADPRPPVRATPRPLEGADFIRFEGVRYHNLDGVDLRLPRGRLTVVTGVSGSGKSSFVGGVLAHAVSRADKPASWREVGGLEGLERLVRVDATPIGKNPRSTPATYVGFWDEIRKLFAKLPEARLRGYAAGRFSFNVAGGRCDACSGNGAVKLEMSFLPDAYVACDVCLGRRFSRQTLHITYDGHSIYDVLEMPVRRALQVFERVPKLRAALQMLEDVGLGYLKLGQPSPTLSGGEAQRIKLATELLGRDRSDTVLLLDEPSTGLHMADVPRLLSVVHRLVDAGATVVVIEHNPDVMREADWLIDMGPGAGADGGRCVYQGPFRGVLDVAESVTGRWLREHGG